jgi:hypothetical protein
LKVRVGAEQEFGIFHLFFLELGESLHGNNNLELAASHTLQFTFEFVGVTTEHLNNLRVLDTVEELDGTAVVHETRDSAVQGLETKRRPDTSTKGVLGCGRLETNTVEGKIVDLALGGVLLVLVCLAVILRGFIGQNLGILDKAVPLVRVQLLEILQECNTRVRLILANDFTERKKDLLAVVGDHDCKGRHVVNGQRLRNGS